MQSKDTPHGMPLFLIGFLLFLSMIMCMSVQTARAQSSYTHACYRTGVSVHNANTQALFSALTGPMRNTPADRLFTNTIIAAGQNVIAELFYPDIARIGAGTIEDNRVVRIDRQSPIMGGGANLQVQIDNLTSGSTIAAALVPARYLALTNSLSEAEVQRVARQALVFSLNSLIARNPGIYEVQGTLSNQ